MHITTGWQKNKYQTGFWLTQDDNCLAFDPSNAGTHWSGILLATFSSHGAFLSKLIAGLTPADPWVTFHPRNVLCSGQGFLWPNYVAISMGISKADWRLTDRWPLIGSLWKVAHKPRGPIPYLLPTPVKIKFQLSTSKHDKTHSLVHRRDFSSKDGKITWVSNQQINICNIRIIYRWY